MILTVTVRDTCLTSVAFSQASHNSVCGGRFSPRLEIDLELRMQAPANAVGERAKIRRGQIVLDITWIGMAGDVEKLDADLPAFVEHRYLDRPQNLEIQRRERRKPSCPVTLTDEVQSLIHRRIREPTPHLEQRRHRDFVRQADRSPEKETLRRIERKEGALVGSDDGARVISEERIEIV